MAGDNGTAPTVEVTSDGESPQAKKVDKIKELLDKLDARTDEIAKRVKEEMLPKAQATVKENIWVSLLVALGLGLILGFVVRLGGSRRD